MSRRQRSLPIVAAGPTIRLTMLVAYVADSDRVGELERSKYGIFAKRLAADWDAEKRHESLVENELYYLYVGDLRRSSC